MNYIMNLANIFVSDVDKAGQRAVDMAELSRNHVKVPLCFVLNEQALEAFVDHNRIKEKGAKFLGEGNYHALQDEIISSSLPGPLVAELTEAYHTLAISEKDGAQAIVNSQEDPYVNVILSPNYRTNGEIVLNVKGLTELQNAIKQVWAILFAQESFEERAALGVGEFFSGIIIQRAPQSRASADVRSFNTPNVEIETYFGYPDMSNKFVKDYFEVDKENLQIVKHDVKHQNIGMAKDENGNLIEVNMSGKGSHQKVDDKIVIELGRLGKKISNLLDAGISATFTIDKALFLLSVDREPDVVLIQPDAEIIAAGQEELEMENMDPIMETDVPELDDDRDETIMPEQEEEFLTELEQTFPDDMDEPEKSIEEIPSFEPVSFTEPESFEQPEEVSSSHESQPEFNFEDSFEPEKPVDDIPSFSPDEIGVDNSSFEEPVKSEEIVDEIPSFSPNKESETPSFEEPVVESEPEFNFDEPVKPEQVDEIPTNFDEPVDDIPSFSPDEESVEETPSFEEPDPVEEVSDDDFKPPQEPEQLPDSFDEPINTPWKEEVEEIDEKIGQVTEIKELIHELEDIAKSGEEIELKHKITELHDAVSRLKYQS